MRHELEGHEEGWEQAETRAGGLPGPGDAARGLPAPWKKY